MAVLTKNEFIEKWVAEDGLFKFNIDGQIDEYLMQEFAQDLADSLFFGNLSQYYTSNQIDTLLLAKVDTVALLNYYTSSEIDAFFSSLPPAETTQSILEKIGNGSLISAVYLPSFVDDVIEVSDYASLPVLGEGGKIYILGTPHTSGGITSDQYRWSGSAYAPIIASPGSTDAVTEGSLNKYFTESRTLATVMAGISFAASTVVTAADSLIIAIGKLQAQITSMLALLTPASLGLDGKPYFMKLVNNVKSYDEMTDVNPPFLARTLLTANTADWTNDTYTGVTAITGTKGGQFFNGTQVTPSAEYFYIAQADNYWIRIKRT